MTPSVPLQGAGLGLRRAMLPDLLTLDDRAVDFLEVAPDNWIGVGGTYGEGLARLAERFPLSCHGLSLSLGGPEPLDHVFLGRVREFLDQHQVPLFSEHLSYCSDEGHLYDLIPMPFTDEAVRHIASRIREVQDVLGRRIAVENISYYAAPYQALSEIDFLLAVLGEADCDLLLDVNNLYVNAHNHGYDAAGFLARVPAERVACLHVAGHYDEAPDLKIDTHGAAVKNDVWSLLASAYQHLSSVPTLLERDFNLPPLAELLGEVATIRNLQAAARQPGVRHG
ncbi:DUF692 domain-containing protein [Pseudomonas sp. LABIM340]|uniref:HvfB family MNIO-type RiPP peptide maturase n=1 Tax=Pseudomonas sp. LABIM340 TaxID=3156585 RepID=UPI0032AF6CDA